MPISTALTASRSCRAGHSPAGKQLTADFDEGVLYWCDREGMQVLRCKLDGSGLRALVVSAVGAEAARDAATTLSASPSTWIGACCTGHRRALRMAVRAGSFVARSTRRPAQRAVRDGIELLWKDLPEPIDLHLVGGGATLLWTDRGDDRRAIRSTARSCSPRSGQPRSSQVDTGRRSVWPRRPNRISMSPISVAASVTSTWTAGFDTELVNLGSPLTGIALADL